MKHPNFSLLVALLFALCAGCATNTPSKVAVVAPPSRSVTPPPREKELKHLQLKLLGARLSERRGRNLEVLFEIANPSTEKFYFLTFPAHGGTPKETKLRNLIIDSTKLFEKGKHKVLEAEEYENKSLRLPKIPDHPWFSAQKALSIRLTNRGVYGGTDFESWELAEEEK